RPSPAGMGIAPIVMELHDKAYVTAADPSSGLACASSRPCRRWHRSQARAGAVSYGKCRTERNAACARGRKMTGYRRRAAAPDGFSNGANDTQVTINHPPSSGYYAGNPGFVEAIISQPRPTLFMGILGFQRATVSTLAIAGAQPGTACIYALDPAAASAFNVNGGATVTASCGIVDESN